MPRCLARLALIGLFAGLPACSDDKPKAGGPKANEVELREKSASLERARRTGTAPTNPG